MSIDAANVMLSGPSSASGSEPMDVRRPDGGPPVPDPARSTEPETGVAETAPLGPLTADFRPGEDDTIRLQPDSAPDPSVPVSLDRVIAGRYCLERELGRGGFGVVMLAYDRLLERQVAIKIARRTSERGIDQLLEEGRKVAQLDHPSVVPVYDCGRIDARTIFIVSKYVDGGSLARRLNLRRLTIDEALTIAGQVADGLAHAHERGLIHRDLKPSNILLDGRDNAFVADFGLALRTSDRSDRVCVEGSPQYMSPEQAAGKSRLVDRRTDVFSFGVILYEMLTGHRPFPGRSTAEYREQVIHEEAPPPSRFSPEIPAKIERVCQKAMSKGPTDRFASAWELAEALREGRDPCGPTRRDSRLAVRVVLAVALLLVALLILGPRLWERWGPAPGPGPLTPGGAVAASPADLDVARWVLSRGGSVDFEIFPPTITAADQLPEEPMLLRTVRLVGDRGVSGRSLAAICALPGLRFLHLADSELSDDDLPAVASRDDLRMLWLGYNPLTDRGLSRLGVLEHLRHLDLEQTGLSDAGLRALADCRGLEFLNISGTDVTAAGLAPLRGLLLLRDLRLNGVALTDASVADLLALRDLERLEVRESGLSDEAFGRLREGLPGCAIER